MSDIQDYQSSLADPASRKFETFSYLPEMTAEQIRRQVEYIVAQGWNPGIEHTEPENASDNYWYMWKLPMFHNAHPGNHVRLLGFDNFAQCAGASMVIYRGNPV
jgi:ribulose-bisphosphate carboxylase small chain